MGTIAFVSGDNLGSQLVGGFKEGSGAHLKCRHCMGTTVEIKSCVSYLVEANNSEIIVQKLLYYTEIITVQVSLPKSHLN